MINYSAMNNNTSDYLTTLLYSYSTTPQVMGAILAISGAFVVFKFRDLKDEMLGISQRIFEYIKLIDHSPCYNPDSYKKPLPYQGSHPEGNGGRH
jgi:hypothetical protein